MWTLVPNWLGSQTESEKEESELNTRIHLSVLPVCTGNVVIGPLPLLTPAFLPRAVVAPLRSLIGFLGILTTSHS